MAKDPEQQQDESNKADETSRMHARHQEGEDEDKSTIRKGD